MSDVASAAIALLACAGMAVAIVAWLRGRLSRYQVFGISFIGQAALAVSASLRDRPMMAGVSAACAGIAAYMWWHGGGGDDTKRRLRKWRTKFAPVRRTATQ